MDSLLSTEQNEKVTTILNQVYELSESEKHVLYLKLPDEHEELLSSKEENNLTLRWIRTHYVEDRDICVLKQDVYNQYRQYCESSGDIPLSSFKFGKMMRLVFPNVHNRRLGQRGNSKYCYGGLRKKEDDSCPNEVLSSAHVQQDLDVYVLSCQLVCEWATQLLGKPFSDIRILAEYLVSKGLSCGKTATKFSILSGSTSPPKLYDKAQKSPTSKHHERQMLLQRKLRHNKLIREHKEKLTQQKNITSTGTARSLLSPAVYQLGHDEQLTNLQQDITGRKIQLRPLSVQPYVWSADSSCAAKKQLSSSTLDLSYDREGILGVNTTAFDSSVAQNASTVQSSDASTAHSTSQQSSEMLKESLYSSVPLKRCHSTSVVEKQSFSLHYALLELTGNTPGKYPSSTEANSYCEVEDGKAMSSSFSSSVDDSSTPVDVHIVSSSSGGVSTGMLPLTSILSSPSVQRSIQQMSESPIRVSIDSLLMPQHPKRYGDSISPDRGSLTKRKCTTSLGVTKQQSLESNMSSEVLDIDIPRSRPYSCPVSVKKSQLNIAIKDNTDVIYKRELSELKDSLTCKISSFRTGSNSPALLSDKRKYDERRKTRPEQHKKVASACHFVQKPTVINRPKGHMNNITSCPNLKDIVRSEEISRHQESNLEKQQSYNILNSLLSLNYDMLSESKSFTKTILRSQHSSPILRSSYVNTLATNEETGPLLLQSSPLRLITNTTNNTVENSSILSSLSSRSAFVPVTSHKLQASNSSLRESDTLMTGSSLSKQTTSLSGKTDQDSLMLSNSNHQSLESLYNESTHTLIKPSISHMPVSGSSIAPTSAQYNLIQKCTGIVRNKIKDYNTTITSSSSSSSSSSSTLCRSGESTSSGCDSVLTTPVPAQILDKRDSTIAISSSTVSVKSSTIQTTCSVPAWSTVAQCKSSSSLGCTTPVMSPLICQSSHNFQNNVSSASITPPKRASKNRFTPIRPKIGCGTNTPSPQKLSGMTTPSPQKKDLRPDIKQDMRQVSTILKEQRVKCAQDLLVNLANNYQGEVKLKMPAEFLGLSPPGKSKSSDVHVTIRSPMNIHHHKSFHPGSTDLVKQAWPQSSPTPPHKEITVIVEPASQPVGHPTASPALSSGLTSTHLPQSFPSPHGVQVVSHNLYNTTTLLSNTLISPNAILQGTCQQTPFTLSSSDSAAQVIILPPVSSCQSLPQNVASSPSKPIIVEDDKGNVYSLDHKSGITVLPQNLQQCLKSSQSADQAPSSLNTSFLSNSLGVLNVAEIKGHVIGPDANGQSYLLVPNSEPVIPTTTTPNFFCQQTSPILATTMTSLPTMTSLHSKNKVTADTSIPVSGTNKSQPAPPSAYISELNQLSSNSGQAIIGQTMIQHNSGSSAFHKCLSSTSRRTSSSNENIKAEMRAGECNNLLLAQSSEHQTSESNVSECAFVAEINNDTPDAINNDRLICGNTSELSKYQGVRKRKASSSQEEEHEDRKRINSTKNTKEDNEEDDDVFIVKIEENSVSKQINENADITESCAQSSVSNYHHTPTSTLKSDNSNDGISEGVSKKLLTDTETLLGMIGSSKSMTVKETIKALNELRAKQNENVSKSYSTVDKEDTVHRDQLFQNENVKKLISAFDKGSSVFKEQNFQYDRLSCHNSKLSSQTSASIAKEQFSESRVDPRGVIVNKPQSTRSSTLSHFTPSDSSNLTEHQETIHTNIDRTGQRHISLNLESLESDALLDTETTLDHRLVGDIKDGASVKTDQKTSVGIAAKSARTMGLYLSSDKSLGCRNKTRQHRQDMRSSQVSLPNDKKDGGNNSTHVSQIQSEYEQKNHQNISVEPHWLVHGSKSEQNTVTEGIPKTVHEQPRSMSCVRDILQHGARQDFVKCVSNMTELTKAELSCQNVKTLSLSNLNQSVSGSKASEHPFLAQCLSVPCKKVLEIRTEVAKQQILDSRSQHSGGTLPKEQNRTETVVSKCSLLENELPGDIADFITESMSCESSYNRDAFRRNSLSTLLADLVRNGQNEREQKCSNEESNATVWRSISVPNTMPDSSYDYKNENRQKNPEAFPITSSSQSVKSQSIAEAVDRIKSVDVQSKLISSDQMSSLAVRLSWECLPEADCTAPMSLNIGSSFSSNLENVKDIYSDHPSQSSECTASTGTFLSPIGPAKLTRRSSVERSSSGDRSTTKTPVEFVTNKCSNERAVPRVRSHTDRNKVPCDRSLTKTPVDRSLNMTPVDRTARKISRDNKSPNKIENPCRDHTTSSVLQQSVKEREAYKLSGNRAITNSPADKIHSGFICESMFNQRYVDGNMQHGSSDSVKGDRSHNQTPISDAGYSSVSQTPISEVGCGSVSPSPVMMSISGLFGECGRQEQTSPATIFMPLRSDSVMSLVNSRSNDGVDCYAGQLTQAGRPFQSVSNITQYSNRNDEDDCDKTSIKSSLFDKDNVGHTSLLQGIIDNALLDHVTSKNDVEADIKRTSDSHSIRDTFSIIDFEKFMSVQLNCIPTPPCSPSASPQLLADTSQSPLSFSVPFSQTLPVPQSRQSRVTPTSSSSTSHHFISSVATISSEPISNSIYVMSSSPGFGNSAGQYSPNIQSNTSPSSHAITHTCFSPHLYYPHPSPPFTPSLQRCLASPSCATPCGDSNTAPNRFMPIQTSGILATSLTQTYIQPIRPVVTLASIANQNSHINLDIAQTEQSYLGTADNKSSTSHTDILSGNSTSGFLYHDNNTTNTSKSKSDADFSSCIDRLKFDLKSKEGDTYRQRKVKNQQKVWEDHKSERTSHPALVLSLTGSIGSVSGQGMQAGWSKDIFSPDSPSYVKKKEHNVSSFPQNTTNRRCKTDRSASDITKERVLDWSREDLSTYTETISLNLLDSQNCSSDKNSTENLILPVSSSQTSSREVTHSENNLHVSDVIGDSKGSLKHDPLTRNMHTLSHVNENVKLSRKLFSGNETFPLSYHSDFPFSHQLAKLSDKSRPSSKNQQSDAEELKSLRTNYAQVPFHEHIQDKHNVKASRTTVLTTMLQTLAHSSSQSHPSLVNSVNSDSVKPEVFQYVSDLPTAYYSGTAPNVDLTKAPFALSSLPASLPLSSVHPSSNETHVDIFLADLGSHLNRPSECPSGNQDELDETLNVLKSLDSHYFQQDDENSSPETSI